MRAPMAIYTTNTFGGTPFDFQRAVTQKLNGNPNMIVMGIDTASRYTYIARGANVNVVDKLGMTPLLWAANVDFGDTAMIELLLKSGAKTDVRNKDGLTPLELARKYGHTTLIPILEKAPSTR